MKRKLLVPILAATAMLAGCATGYQYRGGSGDYYYGQPTVEYHDYGYGGFYGYPGGWGGSLGFGYGYGGWGYGYPYWGYGYPYWGYGYHGYYHPHGGHHHHHGGHDDADSDDPIVPPSSPPPPPGAGVRPPSRALLPGPRTRTPILMRDPSRPVPTLSAPMPSRPLPTPAVTPRIDRGIQVAPPAPSADPPRFQPSLRMGGERDGRRRSER